MGRPLKIAKAQAVLTITDTTAATGAVTVSQSLTTLGIIAGMPFVVATSVGGLSANTTYWILTVIDANNFTASATDLSANTTRTAVTLSDTTGGSVSASVGVVDAWFNNPVTNSGFPAASANTYGVVGGNTAIVGKQVLCNVAFGVNGTGTLFASTASTNVFGLNTDFANIASGSHLYALWGDGTGTPMILGTTSAAGSNVLVGLANTTASGNIIGVDVGSDATDLTVNQPVQFDVTAGGIVAGRSYFVKTIANAAAFTISSTVGGAPVALTTVASVSGNAGQQVVVLDANSANDAAGATGYGDTFVQALPEAGYIVRQKGKTKYLVQGTVTGLVGAVYTANVANTALTPNTMNILSTDASTATAYVSSVNDYQSEVFPATVADGSLTPGSVYTIYSSGNTTWTAYGSASNMTGVTFVATSAGGSGTGTAILNSANPDVIATFNTAYAANTYGGQPNPIVTIASA